MRPDLQRLMPKTMTTVLNARSGALVTRWDGVGTILYPVTGERVPDPQARTQVWDYLKPRPAKWPDATFIVGNPPFIGASRMRDALGDGYTGALWQAYPKMPRSADLVMFWWEKAELAARGYKPGKGKGARRFGLITTNSLRQTFNRAVLDPHLSDPKTPLSPIFAIPDHPSVDAGEGAAVRIAMTVAEAGRREGRLFTVASEGKGDEEAEGRRVEFNMDRGTIFANLRTGADVAGAVALRANEGLSTRGVMLFGSGFIVTREEARGLGLGIDAAVGRVIKSYCNGRDLLAVSRGVMVIDLWGMNEEEVLRSTPKVYQHLRDTVWPERQHNNRESRKKNWWLFGEPLGPFRPVLNGLARFIVTAETTKHRMFQFLDGEVLPDNALIAIALSDSAQLAILSSRFRVVWALAAGGRLGYGNDPRYNKSRCFDPFPTPTEAQTAHLRALGEDLDAHRKARQAEHPSLTLTGMYNVLEKLRAGQRIEGKEREVYGQGLIGILRYLYDQIDAATAEAYGWPATLTDDEILQNLVTLNRARAAEEARGETRWLRPEYQNPAGHAATKGEQAELDVGTATTAAKMP